MNKIVSFYQKIEIWEAKFFTENHHQTKIINKWSFNELKQKESDVVWITLSLGKRAGYGPGWALAKTG